MVEISYDNDILKAASIELPWEKLDGCNILITGATGLIGSCLVEVLMARTVRNYHVYACGRNESRAKKRFASFWSDERFHFCAYDVLLPLNSDIDFHYIIHAASNASPSFFVQNPVEVIKSNIEGVCNLLDYGKQHHLKRFLFVSSGEVYGEGDGRVFSEDYSGYVDPTNVRSCYPSSKRAAETLCVAYCHEYNLDCVIARPCHIYGPHFTESDNRVYAQFIRNVLKGENIIMKSTGEQFRSWCYVVDCVTAMLYILLKGKNGEAYNIADSKSNISIKELAEMIAGIGGKKVIMELPDDVERKGFNLVSKSVFSTEKINALGWKPECSIDSNFRKTIMYLEEK